ncbi:MAG TPA: hypothetical protein VNN72_28585 [Polyangiaceae bacterium]|nr:hypothetical protein [Polyangiaceae bacterium]
MVVRGAKALSSGALALALALPGTLACGASHGSDANRKSSGAGGTAGAAGSDTAGTAGAGVSGAGGSENGGAGGAKGGRPGVSTDHGGSTSTGGDGARAGSVGSGFAGDAQGGTSGTAGTSAPGACLTHAIDIPTARVSGAITVGGSVSSTNSGNVTLSNGEDVVPLGSTSSGTYSVRTVPGTYDVVFVDKGLNPHTIKAGVTVSPAGTTVNIDIPSELTQPLTDDERMVTLSGKLTVNGTPPPAAYTGLALFVQRTDGKTGRGFERFAEVTQDGFKGEIAPGTYDFSYLRTDGMPDPQNFLPGNTGFPLLLAGAVVSTDDFNELDIDVPKADLAARVTVNGETPSATFGGVVALLSPTLGSTGIFDASTSPVFRGQAIPGTYDVWFGSYAGSSDGPLNTHAILKEGVEVLADGSTEIAVDIGSVAVAGAITIDGASVTSKSDYGTLYFGTEAGDKIELATTTTGSYSTRVIPGTYDIFYAVGVPLQASVAPINTYGKVASGVVLAPGAPITLDIDVRTVVATGSVELDGVVVNKETDGGRLWLRTDYGDELPLGWTSAGMFSARVLPGTYQLYYEGTAPSSAAPFNKDARLGCLVVE